MDQRAPHWQVEVFYQGDCPQCSREVALLRALDRGARLRFTDLGSPAFDPGRLDRTRAELVEVVHGRLSDGRWIRGVELYRRIYSAVGLRRALKPTDCPAWPTRRPPPPEATLRAIAQPAPTRPQAPA